MVPHSTTVATISSTLVTLLLGYLLLFLIVFVGIIDDIPQEFAHELLTIVQIPWQLVGMQEDADVAHSLFQFRGVPRGGRCGQIGPSNGSPRGKIVVRHHPQCWRKDRMNIAQ